MSEADKTNERKVAMATFRRLSHIAEMILNGPRAAMMRDDPRGLGRWTELVIRMKSHLVSANSWRSICVYSFPNCVKRTPEDPVFLRLASWDAKSDKIRKSLGNADWPSTSVHYTSLFPAEISLVEGAINALDAEVSSFVFEPQGLDLFGESGFTPLPEDASIVAETTSFEYLRVTRFRSIQMTWDHDERNLSKFDKAWLAALSELTEIAELPDRGSDASITERYEVDLRAYGELFR
jgi:hypothetical protein